MLFFSISCKEQIEDPTPEWKKNQVKVVNDFFAQIVAGKDGDKLYCPGDGIKNNLIYGVQSWNIIDDKGTSQQVGQFDVQLNCDQNGKKVVEKWTISLFRVSEDNFDYCIYKIVPLEDEQNK
jgi:hypothetical protein